jgi:hypothetical protein
MINVLAFFVGIGAMVYGAAEHLPAVAILGFVIFILSLTSFEYTNRMRSQRLPLGREEER